MDYEIDCENYYCFDDIAVGQSVRFYPDFVDDIAGDIYADGNSVVGKVVSKFYYRYEGERFGMLAVKVGKVCHNVFADETFAP